MPIGPERLLKLVKEKGLVTNLSERELNDPEGAGFDLRLGDIYEIEGEGFLGVDNRKTPAPKIIAKYQEGETVEFKFEPEKYYLVTTIEEINLPVELAAYTSMRTTLFRSGMQLLSSPVQPGYKGKLTFGIKNIGNSAITIELGARIVHVQFEEVDGGGRQYRGQWQGGRVATSGMEEQV